MNVLFIISDQHLATCLGVEGHPQVITPNLDRLARESTRFSAAYTQNPICTPSRVSFLSGQYCHNHGYFGLSGPVPDRLPSLFSHFRAAGYLTAGIGNLHTPNDPQNWLKNHLDRFLDYCESADAEEFATPFYDKLRALGRLEDEDIYFFHHNPQYAIEGYPSRLPFELSQEGWCVEEATKFMDECSAGGKKFCMQVSLQRPHQPFSPDRRFWDMYPENIDPPATLTQPPLGRPPHFQAAFNDFRSSAWPISPNTFEAGVRRLWRGYLACITHVDHAVGLLLDHLRRARLDEDTIVVYTADHGAYSGTHGIAEKSPGICSDAVCRIPMIWRVPGVTRHDCVSRQLIQAIDVAPTLASLCGLPPMTAADGKDATALLKGDDTRINEVAVTENVWSKSLRWGRWRFVHYQPEMFAGKNVGELYDIDADPDETRNLYHDAAHQGTVEQGRRLLLEWLIRTTRVRTIWPPPATGQPPKWDFQLADDGKQLNTGGAAQMLARGQLGYL